MEHFRVHAIIQTLALLSFLIGIYYAKSHNLKMHHSFVYTAVGLLTVGISYMFYTIGWVPSTHSRLGLFVYVYVLLTVLSGRAFLGRKITREQHKFLAMIAVLLLMLQILFGLYNYVL
ncbi:Protein of unknown function DUF420 [Thermococcus onnurineus NA1]|uniref:Cytochrome b561 domain-containing protein n=1 Tax=Thermococcus onnurineus (strain NA1) TaxID=523850 RepID=B6YWA0_THEON|nr:MULTISPECIES: hypothetical protein [Thermococcus]ACJ16363.1 Protein of unknown function DUF420 [Thermococcus onnurineus NA1]NJE47712.1 hypothetical protein [Thermococcus sp. GR7]NJE79107.1 hypothetical protein [Thermococcus sp. GR4]NJF22524.1 hypothetical protein [Thermococcus sp. GR5]